MAPRGGTVPALCATHSVADPPTDCTVQWDRFDCLRHDFVLGLALWLLWEEMDADLRLLLAQMLEHDADSWCDGRAPVQARRMAAMNDRYLISPPTIPGEDLSGALGQRHLRMLTRQAERDLQWLQTECAGRIAGHDYTPLFREPSRRPAHPLHLAHQISDCALQFAVLALFGPDEEVAGHTRADLRAIAVGLLRALCATHPVAEPPADCTVQWDRFDCLRHDFVLGLALWLLWEDVDEDLRLLLARMLEHDADSWCDGPAPAQLHDDTQSESNAWSSGGMVLA